MNIEMSYLYRDASNYKQHSSLVFENPESLTPEEVEAKLEQALIEGEYFLPLDVSIPPCFFLSRNDDDHDFHEVSDVSETDAEANDPRTINQLMEELVASKKRYETEQQTRNAERPPKLFEPLKKELDGNGIVLQGRESCDLTIPTESDALFVKKNLAAVIFILDKLTGTKLPQLSYDVTQYTAYVNVPFAKKLIPDDEIVALIGSAHTFVENVNVYEDQIEIILASEYPIEETKISEVMRLVGTRLERENALEYAS